MFRSQPDANTACGALAWHSVSGLALAATDLHWRAMLPGLVLGKRQPAQPVSIGRLGGSRLVQGRNAAMILDAEAEIDKCHYMLWAGAWLDARAPPADACDGTCPSVGRCRRARWHSDIHSGDVWQAIVFPYRLIAFDQNEKLRVKHYETTIALGAIILGSSSKESGRPCLTSREPKQSGCCPAARVAQLSSRW